MGCNCRCLFCQIRLGCVLDVMFEGHDLHDVKRTYLTRALNELSDLRLLENFLTVIQHSKTTNYLQVICPHPRLA